MDRPASSRQDLYRVAASLFLWGMGESLFLIFQPLYLEEMGADPFGVGGLLSINLLVMALAQIPVGHLSDRIGSKPLLKLSWATGILATLVMGFARDLFTYSVGMALYALTGAVMAPLNAYIVAARGDLPVSKALTSVNAAYLAGALIGPMIGGVLAEQIGLRLIYFIASGVFIFSTILIFTIHQQVPLKSVERPPIRQLVLSKRFGFSLALIAVVVFSTGLSVPFSNIFLQNQRGISLAQIGQFGSLANLSGVFFNLILGRASPVLGFLAAEAGMTIFAALLAYGTGIPFIFAAFLFMGSYRVVNSMATAFIRPIVHDAQVGVAFGILETTRILAAMLSPLVSGWLYEQQPLLPFQVSIVLGATIGFVLGYVWLNRQSVVPKLRLDKGSTD